MEEADPDRLAAYTSTSPLSRRSALPRTSRIDPALVQRSAPIGGILGWSARNWFDFAYFLSSKGFDIAGSVVKYGIWGPPKPSWGIEMTLVSAFMRGLAQHSSLTDITLIRQLISVHYLLPLPPDAIVTPITFKVKRRKEPLRGFFNALDSAETGDRELSGEWVVGKAVWSRLKKEKREADAAAAAGKRQRRSSREEERSGLGLDVRPEGARVEDGRRRRRSGKEEKVIYYIHGGAYYVGQAATHRLITIAISKVCDARVFAINYRLSPEARFPSALHDVITGYFRLTDSLHISPSNIIVMGDSAGGGLTLALTMYLRDEGYRNRIPSGICVLSPWVDLTMSCGSWDENAKFDVIPVPIGDDHLNPVQCYLGPEGMKTYLTHPYVSPLFGDFRDFPPMLIQAGEAEVLRDEITLLAHKATLAGVDVKSELFVDAVHVFQTFPFLASATVAFKSIGAFVRKIAAKPAPRPSRPTAVAVPRPGTPLADIASQDGSERESSRGSFDLANGRDSIGREIEAAGETMVRSDGTEVDVEPEETPRPSADVGSEARTAKSSEIDLTEAEDVFESKAPPEKPLYRRALTSFSKAATIANPRGIARRTSVSFLMSSQADPTRSNPNSPSNGSAGLPSPRRPRGSSVVADSTLSPAKPTTRRVRSKSNVDMADMMERYAREGPANPTTVYTVGKDGSGVEDDPVDEVGSELERDSDNSSPGLGLSLNGKD